MKRRQLILGLGATAAGGSALVGSGAFSSVETERTFTVDTADDDDAYLRLTIPGGETDDRSFRDDGTLQFIIPGLRERLEDDGPANTNPEDPAGLGEDSVYRFARETDGNELFRAENQGTEPIKIHSVQDQGGSQDNPEVQIFAVDSGELLTEGSPSEELAPGQFVDLGLQIDTTDIDVDQYVIPLTIVAERADE